MYMYIYIYIERERDTYIFKGKINKAGEIASRKTSSFITNESEPPTPTRAPDNQFRKTQD